MFKSILVVCTGNICRSPIGERLLRQHLPDRHIASAGIYGLEGSPADDSAQTWPAAWDLPTVMWRAG